jgi:5-methylcytosine-specific restriction endonuclease McrBC regulatory subunit McrC
MIQGKANVLPCRWDEFTVDNWDNRILWAAAQRLRSVAQALDVEAASVVWQPFQQLLSWFSPVSEVPISTADFHRSRLGRTSRFYQRALIWARLLLQGSDLPVASGRIPPLILNTPPAFENFAKLIVRAALPDSSWRLDFRVPWTFLTGRHAQDRIPDFLISNSHGVCAVGDAKYKDVLEKSAGESLRTFEDVRAHIQAADWNQLYVYMRAKGASCGFFVVPFWNAGGPPSDWLDDLGFSIPPCDGTVRVAVLALNLLQPLRDVKQEAANRLCAWLSD